MKYQISLVESTKKERRNFCEFFAYKNCAGLEFLSEGSARIQTVTKGKPDKKNATNIWRMLRLKDGSFIASGDCPNADDHDRKTNACRISGEIDCRDDECYFEPLEFYDSETYLKIRVREAIIDERFYGNTFRLFAPDSTLANDSIDFCDMQELLKYFESGAGEFTTEDIYGDWPTLVIYNEDGDVLMKFENVVQLFKENGWIYAHSLDHCSLIRLNPERIIFNL